MCLLLVVHDLYTGRFVTVCTHISGYVYTLGYPRTSIWEDLFRYIHISPSIFTFRGGPPDLVSGKAIMFIVVVISCDMLLMLCMDLDVFLPSGGNLAVLCTLLILCFGMKPIDKEGCVEVWGASKKSFGSPVFFYRLVRNSPCLA